MPLDASFEPDLDSGSGYSIAASGPIAFDRSGNAGGPDFTSAGLADLQEGEVLAGFWSAATDENRTFGTPDEFVEAAVEFCD